MRLLFIILITVICTYTVSAQVYPDRHYVLRIDSLYANIESSSGIRLSDDGKSIMLQDGVLQGEFITKPQYSEYPFDLGLPSWNGTAPDTNSSFKIQIRFPVSTGGWSTWLTVGFWQANIWSNYGYTSFSDGKIKIDFAELTVYKSSWQFRVLMTRTSSSIASPTINKLSFFTSDSRTTSSINYTTLVNDNPDSVFIPTTFIHQYSVDPVIGGSICSPTSVSMILRSYGKYVNPLTFAQVTYDPYWKIFGVWPRVVQNAHQFELDGAVTRYRTWSEAREVLANGGRIAMSVGLPLYTGHLMMLAGFTSDGRPIVHDPAKSNGYAYIFDKLALSQSWFGKGGVAYTFYPVDNTVSVDMPDLEVIAKDFKLYQNYPNPFNPVTTIGYVLTNPANVKLTVYNQLGQEVEVLVDDYKPAGFYEVNFSSNGLSSGVYYYKLSAGGFIETKKMVVLK